MKYAIFLFLILIIGCKTPQIITRVETVTDYRDTTIYVKDSILYEVEIPVPVPSDSVRIRDSVRIINNHAYLPPKHYREGLIAVDAKVVNNKLIVDAYLTDSTILYKHTATIPYEDSIRIVNAIKETITKETVVLPPEKYVSKFSKFTHWYFFVSIILIAAIVFIYIKLKGTFGSIKLTEIFKNLVK